MIKNVIIHVGPPKTGTTAIQGALSSIAGDLKQHGIFYPETTPPSKEGHPSLAWEILEALGMPVARMSKAQITWAQAVNATCINKCDTLFISSEDFTLLDKNSLIRMREILSGFSIIVIYGLRDPVHLVPSIWQQSVKWGIGFGEQLMDVDDAVPFIIENRRNSASYLRTIQETLKCKVRAYIVPSGVARDMLFLRFAQAVAFPSQLVAKFCDAGRRQNANERLSYRYLRMLLHINRIIYQTQTDKSNNIIGTNICARETILRCIEQEKICNAEQQVDDSIPLSSKAREILVSERKIITDYVINNCTLIWSENDIWENTEPVSGYSQSECEQTDPAHVESAACRILARALAIQANKMIDLHAYLLEVEKARDWWKNTSARWECVAHSNK